MAELESFLTVERLARVEFNCYVIVKSKKWVSLINDELFKQLLNLYFCLLQEEEAFIQA